MEEKILNVGSVNEYFYNSQDVRILFVFTYFISLILHIFKMVMN